MIRRAMRQMKNMDCIQKVWDIYGKRHSVYAHNTPRGEVIVYGTRGVNFGENF